jgi:hypothetical protein
MDAGIIVAIIVVVVVVAVLLALMPRLRHKREERRLGAAREERAGEHRDVAEDRRTRARLAEHEAARARAEAERAKAEAGLHEARADLHDRGMADEELPNGDMPPRDDSERDIVHERERSGAAYEGDPADGRTRETRDEGAGSDAVERDAEGRPIRR